MYCTRLYPDNGRTINRYHARSSTFLGHSPLSKMFKNQIVEVSAETVEQPEGTTTYRDGQTLLGLQGLGNHADRRSINCSYA